MGRQAAAAGIGAGERGTPSEKGDSAPAGFPPSDRCSDAGQSRLRRGCTHRGRWRGPRGCLRLELLLCLLVDDVGRTRDPSRSDFVAGLVPPRSSSSDFSASSASARARPRGAAAFQVRVRGIMNGANGRPDRGRLGSASPPSETASSGLVLSDPTLGPDRQPGAVVARSGARAGWKRCWGET